MDSWARVRQVFEAVVELSGDEREERLQQLCGDDPELRNNVAELLAEDASTMEAPIESRPEVSALPDPSRLRQIGSYQVVRVLGSGGMGTVFEARQEHPSRSVALKVLRTMVASESARRRLEYEAETLGRLQHPNVAQIHESGTWSDADTGEEMPFFAMEYVADAKEITSYADDAKLGLRQRIELFLSACDAVQHGHQQGVLHRDLKPANILVGGDGLAKVIDFGIARAIDMADDGRTLRTLTGQVLGTPGYMSPEQIDGDAGRIDVRADVYGLAATLHELLVGRPPYDKGEEPLGRFLARLRDETPKRPSTVENSTMAVPAELDWVLLRALAAEPNERYASVSEFSADLRRFLSFEPLVARPPTRSYLLRKFVRRYRVAVIAGGAVLLALIAGTFATSLGWSRALKAEQLADGRRLQAENLARELWSLTELQADILKGTDGDRNVLLVDAVDRASKRLHAAPPESDQVAGGLHSALGVAFLDLGMTDRAQEHFDRALARTDSGSKATAELASAVRSDYARLLLALGKLEEAEAAKRLSLSRRVELYGDGHWRAAFERGSLAAVLAERGEHAEAVGLYRQAMEVYRAQFGPKDERMLPVKTGLATSLHKLGQSDAAASLYEEACALAEETYGIEAPRTLSTRNTFAVFLLETKRLEEAASALQELWDVHSRVHGPAHTDTLRVASNLAVCFERQKDYAKAEATYRHVLRVRAESGAPTDLVDLITRFNLCVALHLQEDEAKVQQAVKQLDTLLVEAGGILPATNWRLAVFRQHRAIALRKLGRFVEAETDLTAAREVLEARLGTENSRTHSNWQEAVLLYEAWGKPDEVAKWRDKLTNR